MPFQSFSLFRSRKIEKIEANLQSSPQVYRLITQRSCISPIPPYTSLIFSTQVLTHTKQNSSTGTWPAGHGLGRQWERRGNARRGRGAAHGGQEAYQRRLAREDGQEMAKWRRGDMGRLWLQAIDQRLNNGDEFGQQRMGNKWSFAL